MLRDRVIDLLSCLAAAALLVFLGGQWLSLHRMPSTPGPATSIPDPPPGFAVTAITGPNLELQILGDRDLALGAASAELLMPQLGPFQLNLAPRGMDLVQARARISDPALHIRAERCRLIGDRLTFTGAVRLDMADGRGLLFSDRLELSLEKDHVQTGDLAILSPEGRSGGQGGRVVPGFGGTLAALLDRAR